MPLPIFKTTETGKRSSADNPPDDVNTRGAEHKQDPHAVEKKAITANLQHVKRIIGVHSGKGGVGKTFIAVNLAFALSAAGKKVGLLDADIDCPNIVRFLNITSNEIGGDENGRIFPFEHRIDEREKENNAHGNAQGAVKIMSTHFLTETPDAPLIIRGPIKHNVFLELLSRVEWGSLDVLIYDLPPGTSDVPLSSLLIGQLSGIIIVTTPQKEALYDARKSALLARELHIPIIGIVENMAGNLFGSDTNNATTEIDTCDVTDRSRTTARPHETNPAALARELHVPLLASLPLSREISRLNHDGKIAFLDERFLQPELLKAAAGDTKQETSQRAE